MSIRKTQLKDQIDPEYFSDSFVASQYIENFSFKYQKTNVNSNRREKYFDIGSFKRNLELKLEELTILSSNIDKEIVERKNLISKKLKSYQNSLDNSENDVKTYIYLFKDLNSSISNISEKVLEIGRELENCSIPSDRASQAIDLIQNFNYFLNNTEDPFKIKDTETLLIATKRMHSIVSISDDLNHPIYKKVKETITECYNKLTNEVLVLFAEYFTKNAFEDMKKCADVLLSSKVFSRCYLKLIELCLKVTYNENIFNQLIERIETSYDIINLIFPTNSRLILNSFVQYIYENILTGFIHDQLTETHKGQNEYLAKLNILVKKTMGLEKNIIVKGFTIPSTTLELYRKTLYEPYLKTYFDEELKNIKDFYITKLNSSYAVEIHKNFKNPLVFTQSPKIIYNKLVSQDLINIAIQANRAAIERCETLSSSSDLANHVNQIFTCLLDLMVKYYMSMVVELAFKALPPTNPKQAPTLEFFKFVSDINVCFHFIDKHFSEYVFGHINSSSYYHTVFNYLNKLKTFFQNKIDEGIDTCLASYINWMKLSLITEQKLQDFCTDDINVSKSVACDKVCFLIDEFYKELMNYFEAHNHETIAHEFAMRFVKILIDHIQNYTISCTGAMNLLCDIKEYGSRFEKFPEKKIKNLFTTLCSLIDVLVVSPGHVKELLNNEELNMVDKELIQNFVQIRRDYKEAKIGRII